MSPRDQIMLIIGFVYGNCPTIPDAIENAMASLMTTSFPASNDVNKQGVDVFKEIGKTNTWTERVQSSNNPERDENAPDVPLIADIIPNGMKIDEPVKEKKPRKEMSEETKEKLRAALVIAREVRKQKSIIPAQIEPAKPFVTISSEKLISDHSEYAGEREDRTLVASDWGDIKRMRTNGLPAERICKSYGVGETKLTAFISMMEEQDRGQLGNF